MWFLQEERVKKVEEEQEKCTFERENMLKIVWLIFFKYMRSKAKTKLAMILDKKATFIQGRMEKEKLMKLGLAMQLPTYDSWLKDDQYHQQISR